MHRGVGWNSPRALPFFRGAPGEVWPGAAKLIHLDLVVETKRLQALGTLSQRAIALRVGISRGSVGNILHGRRREDQEQCYPGVDETPCPPTRCGGCGGKIVILPCRLCRARAALAAAERRPIENDPPTDFSLELDLPPQERARYEQVHQLEESQGDSQAADQWEEPLDDEEADQESDGFDQAA